MSVAIWVPKSCGWVSPGEGMDSVTGEDMKELCSLKFLFFSPVSPLLLHSGPAATNKLQQHVPSLWLTSLYKNCPSSAASGSFLISELALQSEWQRLFSVFACSLHRHQAQPGSWMLLLCPPRHQKLVLLTCSQCKQLWKFKIAMKRKKILPNHYLYILAKQPELLNQTYLINRELMITVFKFGIKNYS